MRSRILLVSVCLALAPGRTAMAQVGNFDKAPVVEAEEDAVVTPPGFQRAGHVATAISGASVTLRVTICDAGTGEPTPCRVNVVGPDGNFYHPADNRLAPYSLLGHWPDQGQGNRPGKAPIRYFGHFFYTTSEFTVEVPEGEVRVEAWRGFEYRPETVTVDAQRGGEQEVKLTLRRAVDTAAEGYYGGDPHLHFPRGTDAEDKLIFDLLEAEDVGFGVVMCYNETDRYQGLMSTLNMPQGRGLGRRSVAARGPYAIVSGQEYRNAVYGHINLFWRDNLVLDGQSLDPNGWPVFGEVARETRALGGYAFYAHGGYAQEIYADLAHGAINGVELLQFGIYRGIGLEGWYHVLNAGLSCPALGASDYPACRKLSDCRTYVQVAGEPTFEKWLAGAARGASFITSAPLLFFDVNGNGPGARIPLSAAGPNRLAYKLRVESPTSPVTHYQIIVGGVATLQGEFSAGSPREILGQIETDRPTWIAARVYSKSASGNADAEAHTNPVYIDLDGRAVFSADSARWLTARIDEQIAQHRERQFERSAEVVAYFAAAKARLEALIAAGGRAAPTP